MFLKKKKKVAGRQPIDIWEQNTQKRKTLLQIRSIRIRTNFFFISSYICSGNNKENFTKIYRASLVSILNLDTSHNTGDSL